MASIVQNKIYLTTQNEIWYADLWCQITEWGWESALENKSVNVTYAGCREYTTK